MDSDFPTAKTAVAGGVWESKQKGLTESTVSVTECEGEGKSFTRNFEMIDFCRLCLIPLPYTQEDPSAVKNRCGNSEVRPEQYDEGGLL